MSDENPTLPLETAGAPLAAAVKDSSMPRGVPNIVGNEAAERFSFYGMKGLLTGYITGSLAAGGLAHSKDQSNIIISLFGAGTYFMPLLGGWFSDKIVGRYHTILWVSLLYCVGHGILACSDLVSGVEGKMICLCAGLSFIAFGAGGIKPCVSAFMGDQFKPNQAHLLQKAYGAFYWAINFGSFFSFLIIPWIKDKKGYGLAFGVPGIAMGIATFVFWLGTKHYFRVPPSRDTKQAGFISVFWHAYRSGSKTLSLPSVYILATIGIPLLVMILITYLSFQKGYGTAVQTASWAALICVGLWYALVLVLSFLRKTDLPDQFWQKAANRFSPREIIAARSVGPILFIFALVPAFWSLFDQMQTTWVSQGQMMTPATIFGYKIGAEQMQSANPAIVMILVPILTLLVYPRMGRFASPLRRMSFGMFIASVAYLVVAALQAKIQSGAHLSVLWQIVPYIIMTTAEVLVSTTGLEFAFREAAPEMKSTIMSFWLLTVSMGDLILAWITKMLSKGASAESGESVTSGRFLLYAGMIFTVAVIFSAISTVYRYRDKEAAEGR